MLVYYFVPFIVSNRYLLFRDSNSHNSVTVQIRTQVYMNFFDHKDLGNHLLQLCPKFVKYPVYIYIYRMSQEECARLREGVLYVKVHRYNPKQLCPKLKGYGDNGQRF